MKLNLNTREERPVESNVSVWERVPIDIGRIEFRLDPFYRAHKVHRLGDLRELRVLHVTDRVTRKTRAYPLFRIALKMGRDHRIGWEGITPVNKYGPFYRMNAKLRAIESVLEEFEPEFLEWIE